MREIPSAPIRWKGMRSLVKPGAGDFVEKQAYLPQIEEGKHMSSPFGKLLGCSY